MRQWSATIRNFHKGRYWNNEQILSVKAGRAHTAVQRVVKRYLDSLPRGTRIEGLSIDLRAIRVKKAKPQGIQPGLAQAAQDFLNKG